MNYTFYCPSCNKEEEREIKMADYDNLKNKQVCKCGHKMYRRIEWQGMATGSGEGWFGKNGGKAI